jgi:hypothetical protein
MRYGFKNEDFVAKKSNKKSLWVKQCGDARTSPMDEFQD